MKLVTDQWKRRDGKPLISVFQHDSGRLLQVGEFGWRVNHENGRFDQTREICDDLLPVPRELVYRPFHDLAEAFSVMGPTHWIASSNSISHQWFLPSWNPHLNTINGYTMEELYESFVCTNNPSDKTGRVCGVEVTE